MRRASWLAAVATGAVVAGMLALAGAAPAAELRLYPVKGLYGLEHTDCDADFDPRAGVETAKIARAFCPAFTAERRAAVAELFRQRVAAAFPGAAQTLGDPVAAGETPEASLSKTVIASLHLSRADLWVVEKPVTDDVYVPITVSLLLTNALTGEVMFVENYSTIVQGTLGKDNYLEAAQRALDANLDGAVTALVANAAARFKPYAVTGKVRGRAGRRYVFDVGRKGGVREGDTLGADAKVVFSDANYSIIEPMLGELSVGQTLSRQVAQPVDVLARPSALVVVAQYPPGTSRGYINAVFEDALAEGAGLAVTPVNPSFANLRRAMLGEAKVSGAYENARLTPDYFVRVSVAVLDPLDLDTNLAHARRQVYEAHAFVEVVDHAGRVVFATQATSRITDEVLHGVAFSPEQRRDTVIKNALVQAAAALNKGLKPARLRLDARPVGDEVQIADAGGALDLGAKAMLLRRTGGVSGVTGEVWAPVGELEVVATDAAGARARFSDVEPGTVRAGDQIAYDSGVGLAQSRREFAPCVTADDADDVSQRGAVAVPLFGAVAQNAFAANFQAPVRLARFDRELAPYIHQFGDAAQLGVLHPRAAEICFQPVYQVDPAGEKVAGTGQVSPVLQVVMGFVLRRGDQKVASAGLQQVLTATSLPAQASPETRNASLQYDLAAAAAGLAAQAARTLKPPE